ncbi:hypothetical protein D7Y13_35770 [Corallococcus praedator]|uniref:Metallophosphatase n=1 Tax=Corallococcus praedator TaxID=2316724 RepID=A0ABX9Q6Q9_9BACT|nr:MULTISPECIES: hypothetical protein [Corallococcus]RKH20408.1 hypothetical protein D7X75_37885 [Corallococcus sp. CA031C]RKH92687.1 hypothetical protein D7Y13_35770 [Corallococcus praedator]
MEGRWKQLYESLGYRPPASVKVTPSANESTTTHALQTEAPLAADTDLPVLGPEELEALRAAFLREPEDVLRWTETGLGARVTVGAFVEVLRELELLFTDPGQLQERLDATERQVRQGTGGLPPDFTFPLKTEEIPIDPTRTRFEPRSDLRGWLLFSGPVWLEQGAAARQAPFRWHFGAKSRFLYPLREPEPGQPVEVALFGDFGTGEYTSRYIARQLVMRGERLDCAVHLGGVFYAGRQGEFDAHVAEPLEPLLATTTLLTLNAAPEMRSGAGAYFRYLDERRGAGPRHPQEGTYFCLAAERFQLIGLDTAWFEAGRHREPALLQWLEQRLSEGRRRGAMNILLSHAAPYGPDRKRLAPLVEEDLRALVVEREWVDLWCWGGAQGGALYDRAPGLPFLGASLGHGGFPYERKDTPTHPVAPVRFFESWPRFPEWTGVRQDRGNHGHATLWLHADGTATLRYTDWMGQVRCEATLARQGTKGPVTLKQLDVGG